LSKYDYLGAEAQTVIEKDAEERIMHILDSRTRWFVPHSKASSAVKKVRRALLTRGTNRNLHLAIVGDSNAGKTQVIKEALASIYGTSDSKELMAISNVHRMECSSRMDENGFYQQYLAALNWPSNARSSVAENKRAVLKALQSGGHKKLVIDEVQKLVLQSNSMRTGFFNTLTELSNDDRCCTHFFLCGKYETLTAIQQMPDLISRFQVIHMHRLAHDREFYDTLRGMRAYLPLRKEFRLDRELGKLLHDFSEGLIGWLARILATAAEEAIESGEEAITPEIIRALNFSTLLDEEAEGAESRLVQLESRA
jgi:type II secretory pathway predicted ATPase ExeA